MASYDPGDLPQNAEAAEPAPLAEPAEPSETPEPEGPPDPWYRNRVLLVAWATVVAILIVLIIYGLIQLSHGAEGGPTTTTPSTTPPSSTPEEQGPPTENGPPPAQSPVPEEPPHRHHLHVPHIPSTITLPHTVVTLPPGF